MNALLWQSAALLLAAYFLGAFAACLVRRSFFSGTLQPDDRAGLQAAMPGAPSAPPPAPERRFEPTLAGRPATSPADAALRFERALTGGQVPVTASTPANAELPSPRPPSPPAATVPPVRSTAAALAATAAAVAAAERSRRSAVAAPEAKSRPLNLPAAAGTHGPAAVAAPLEIAVPATQYAAPADDLTRIRAIDGGLQGRLNELGIGRYAELAEWRRPDVTRISAALGFKGRIERENWIEQAQILAKGGVTVYARRKARGGLTLAEPTPEEGERLVIPTLPVAPPPRNASGLSSAQVAGQAVDGRTKPRTGMSAGRDNLQRISGITADVERLLNVQGISRYADIAGWSDADVSHFGKLVGDEKRIAGESWIEQGQVLARGGETAFSRDFDRRAAELVGEVRPTRLADAIRDTAAKAAGPERARTPRSDLSSLRSVRSDAYRTPESTGSAATAATLSSAYAARVGRSGAPDDLKRIRGVGVLIEKKLSAMGVTSYNQIANWTADDIERVSQVLDFKGRIERENWVEQARILASGGQTEFSRRVDRGEVDSSRPKSGG